MTQVSITSVVREALLNNTARSYTIGDIADNLGVCRHRAKQLLFAFIYFATEDSLQVLKETGSLPK